MSVVMPIGIFASYGKGEGLGASLDAVKRLGVSTVQLAAPHDREGRSHAPKLRQMFADSGVDVTVVFCGFEGTSYETVEIVERTVGLAPKETRAARLQATLEISDFAHELGCPAIGMHLGVMPTDISDPQYAQLVETTRQVCDHAAGNGQRFHLETGQETAEELLEFFEKVDRQNLAINFDPANMILYDKGEPIAALRLVGKHVRSVHCKDATRRRMPGQKWYEDCPLGEGDVGIENFVRTLHEVGYAGPLTIEREYSPDQENDLARAIRFLEEIKSRVL